MAMAASTYPLGRAVWSLKHQQSMMAVGLGTRQAADEEARAEVEVRSLYFQDEFEGKAICQLLERSGLATEWDLDVSAIALTSTSGPQQQAGEDSNIEYQIIRILGSTGTEREKCAGGNWPDLWKYTEVADIDGVITAIERIRQPSDIKSNEEEIIRKGPEKAGLAPFLSSVKRVNKALSDLKQTNLRSNQQAAADLSKLLKYGSEQLEQHFQRLLQEDSNPIEPLHYITKDKPFPMLSQDKSTRLGLINSYVVSVARQSGSSRDSPMLQVYANIRGPYLVATLQNLAAASVNTAKKKSPDAVYRQGTNGLGTYAMGMEGAFLAEYGSISSLFARDEWGKVFNLCCQGAISELARTLRDLDLHIKANFTTDCFLAYEIIEIMSNLSSNMEERTGELKPSLAAALKPIRETGKSSLSELLDDTRRRIASLPTVPQDSAAMPITQETMTRLQTMVDFLRPISSIMVSIGDGGWKTNASSSQSLDQIPTLNSFDVGADGKEIFANYSMDTIDILLSSLEQKARPLLKGKPPLGVFIANNATIVDRMIRTSELQPLLQSRMADVDKWRKNGASLYGSAWREPSTHLLDVQYTNRGGQRPPSGSAAAIDSAAIIKGLSSKDKDTIKEKFRLFNASFDDLVQKHKSMSMEREVREMLGRQVQQMIEPLYGRFWDRYHEVDKGKGKYVKYDKGAISAIFLGLS
ncbi:probable exocyst complex protein EXO70 [Rhynchosporium secalis]|uniref:Exocyst complex protein EXO70 n=1 Tax=Rhynchosporium secalis TaxID=38038 RepID=A0A1E1M3J9_RHYSE|nr:probable exocyst complex protein EXO70 [Rhynchosporium secalis]